MCPPNSQEKSNQNKLTAWEAKKLLNTTMTLSDIHQKRERQVPGIKPTLYLENLRKQNLSSVWIQKLTSAQYINLKCKCLEDNELMFSD